MKKLFKGCTWPILLGSLATCLLPLKEVAAQSTDTLQRHSIGYKLLPKKMKFQYAGSIGFISTGFGYETKNKKWQADLMYGWVPETYADEAIHSITLKTRFAPIHRSYDALNVNWLNAGMLFNYSFGENYFVKQPSHYEPGYYLMFTALNTSIFVGSEAYTKQWGFYYELGTSSKHLINYAKSPKAISFKSIWNIGLGINYYLK